MGKTLLAGAALCAMCLTDSAMAGGPTQDIGQTLTIEQASQALRYSAGNDRYRIELAPNYSEELGFSMKGAAGAYLSDQVALGLIVEYGANSSEYLANAGIQFTDALNLVGSVGLLEQSYEYIQGDGRKSVQQMEYGASLKGDYEAGILSGFELNGYLTNADTGSNSVEAGDLYGVQLLADLDLTNSTHVKVGGGYEWLEWDEGGSSDSFAFSAEATQQLGDMFSLNGNVNLGASEYVYGGGLALDLSRGSGNTNALALSYEYIQGQNGVQDDQRVELSWSYGFGSGPTQVAAVETKDAGFIRPTADVATLSAANNLLNDVTKRPSYLPQTVIARAKKANQPNPPPAASCLAATGADVAGVGDFSPSVPDTLTFGAGSIGTYIKASFPITSVSVIGINASAIELLEYTEIPPSNGYKLYLAEPAFDPNANLRLGGKYTLSINGKTCTVTLNCLDSSLCPAP